VPFRQARIVRVIAADTDVRVTEFTDAGDPVDGNPLWYGDGAGGFLWAGATNVPHPTVDDGTAPDRDLSAATTDPMMPVSPPSAPPADADLTAAVDRTTMALPAKEFFSELTRKDLIVLHFTAGTTARSAFDNWRRDPEHIAAAYLVDTDGKVYDVFPSPFWAPHLGALGTRNVYDRRSIGIEIVNAGPLQRSNDDPSRLNSWLPRRPNSIR
jgi:hypothetical protein